MPFLPKGLQYNNIHHVSVAVASESYVGQDTLHYTPGENNNRRYTPSCFKHFRNNNIHTIYIYCIRNKKAYNK